MRFAPSRSAMILSLAAVLAPSLSFADEVNVDVDVDVKVRPTVTVVTEPPAIVPVAIAPSSAIVAPPEVVIPAEPMPLAITAPLPFRSRLGGDRWEFGLLGEVGRFKRGDLECAQIGLRAEIAKQLGPLRLGIEGTAAHIDDSPYEQGEGELLRAGATVRVRAISIDRPTRRNPFPREVAWFLESGAGMQHMTWETGAPDERWDLMLGTGLDIAGGADHVSGFNLGLRLHVAESPEVNTHDIGVLFGIGGFYGT